MEGLEMCLLDAIYSLLNSFTRLIALSPLDLPVSRGSHPV